MEPIVFVYCFLVDDYNVFVTMEFLPYVSMMEVEFSQDPSNDGTQEFGDVETFSICIITDCWKFVFLYFPTRLFLPQIFIVMGFFLLY